MEQIKSNVNRSVKKCNSVLPNPSGALQNEKIPRSGALDGVEMITFGGAMGVFAAATAYIPNEKLC